jgi:hypothetical protein
LLVPPKISAKKESVTQRNSERPRPSLSQADLVARNAFFRVILHRDDVTLSPKEEAERLSASCVVWYSKFLECRFKGAWTTVTRDALENLSPTVNVPQLGEIGTAYNFMSVVARLLLKNGYKGLAISEIVDAADNLKLFKDQKDEERLNPTQLVFAAVGWLSKSPKCLPCLTKSNATIFW